MKILSLNSTWKAVKVLLTVALFGWMLCNLATLNWAQDPTRAASSFAREFGWSIPETNWWPMSLHGRLPGVEVTMNATVHQGNITVVLRSFLGLGWEELAFDFTEDARP
jgi:hypothetical protein